MSGNILSLIKQYYKHYIHCRNGCVLDKVYSTDPFIRECSVCGFVEETSNLWKK